MRFKDRTYAGRQLAELLSTYKNHNPYIFALPRGGVPVGYEIAKKLDAPLDIVVVRKLGVPFNPELGFGAIAPGEIVITNDELISAFDISDKEIEYIKAKEKAEMDRRIKMYRGDNIMPDLTSKTAILVDDGIATGLTARAAIRFIKNYNPKIIVVAAPVCAPDSLQELKAEADDVVCIDAPFDFRAVAEWYREFPQVSDDSVVAIMKSFQIAKEIYAD